MDIECLSGCQSWDLFGTDVGLLVRLDTRVDNLVEALHMDLRRSRLPGSYK